MVWGLTFKSFIQLQFIVVYGLVSLFLHVSMQFSQQPLLKRLYLLHHIFLPPLPLIDYIFTGLFHSYLFCSINLCANFMSVPCSFDYYSLVMAATFCQAWGHLMRVIIQMETTRWFCQVWGILPRGTGDPRTSCCLL